MHAAQLWGEDSCISCVALSAVEPASVAAPSGALYQHASLGGQVWNVPGCCIIKALLVQRGARGIDPSSSSSSLS